MYFAEDPEHNFYYLGSEEPRKGLYTSYLQEGTSPIGVDVETISLKERIAIGVGIAVRPDIGFYFPLFPEPSPATPWHLLKDSKITKIMHNALFDLGCVREYEWDTTNIRDTAVMSRLLCHPFSGLVNLSHIHLMEVHEVREILKVNDSKVMLDLPRGVVARKCMQDCMATLKLDYKFIGDIDLDYLSMEMQLIPILIKMSERGLLIDQEWRANFEKKLDEEVEFLRSICEEEGFNPASPKQVGYILGKRGAYSVFARLPFTQPRNRGSLATGKEILEQMDDPLATIILQYKQKASLLNNYIRPWAKEERASTRFHLDAVTGRVSSTDRNLTNVPQGEARGIYIPDSGVFLDADFSQLELRVLAHLSNDREMQHVLNYPNGDIHQNTANFMEIDRRVAKNVGFAMIYGGSDQTIMQTAHIRSKAMATRLRESWFSTYREAGDWIQYTQSQALSHPYATTIMGRKIRLPLPDEESIGGIQRKAINYPIQGSAAEVLKRALILCKDLPVALQVHDELLVDGVLELPAGVDELAPFPTPMDVRFLMRWE